MRASRWVSGLVVLSLLSACGSGDDALSPSPAARDTTAAAATSEEELAAYAAEVLTAERSLPGLAVAVLAPAAGVDVAVAVGWADQASGRALSPDDPFRVASVTKTFTAAAVMRLVEEGSLSLDDPIVAYLPPELVTPLRRDGYATGEITVRDLLAHTGGLADYATAPAYEAAIIADPTHRWTRAEQLAFAVEHGDPLAEPGEVFAYSDTAYILLAAIVERLTGRPMAEAYRSLLRLDGLGLRSTWLETLEAAPPGAPPLAHVYEGSVDASRFDPSIDLWGEAGTPPRWATWPASPSPWRTGRSWKRSPSPP